MPNAAGSARRIGPRQMVARTVRDSPALVRLPRLALGIVASIVVLMFTANVLGLWSFLPALVAGGVTAWTANGRRLLQIGAEVTGRSNRNISSSAKLSNTEPVTAIDIFPDDWICSYERYKEILEDAERKDRRQRERAEWRKATSGQLEEKRNYGLPKAAEDPAVPLKRVIATQECADKKTIVLIFASGNESQVPCDEKFHHRRPKVKPSTGPVIHKAAEALSGLLNALAKDGVIESDLIDGLLQSHSDASVHRALRAALSQHLIEQEVGLGRFCREACAIFSPRMDAGFRRKCMVSLSRAGEAWARNGDATEFQKGEIKDPAPMSASGVMNNFFFGGQTFNNVASVQDIGRPGDFLPPEQKTSEGNSSAAEGRKVEAGRGGSDELTVAWSAGVSASSAGLAALFLAGGAPWQRALLISLAFISACTFVILIMAGLASVKSWRRRLHRTMPGRDTSADADPTEHAND